MWTGKLLTEGCPVPVQWTRPTPGVFRTALLMTTHAHMHEHACTHMCASMHMQRCCPTCGRTGMHMHAPAPMHACTYQTGACRNAPTLARTRTDYVCTLPHTACAPALQALGPFPSLLARFSSKPTSPSNAAQLLKHTERVSFLGSAQLPEVPLIPMFMGVLQLSLSVWFFSFFTKIPALPEAGWPGLNSINTSVCQMLILCYIRDTFYYYPDFQIRLQKHWKVKTFLCIGLV